MTDEIRKALTALNTMQSLMLYLAFAPGDGDLIAETQAVYNAQPIAKDVPWDDLKELAAQYRGGLSGLIGRVRR